MSASPLGAPRAVRRVVEPYRRYDRSMVWQLHDAAWRFAGQERPQQGVPSFATTNRWVVRCVARALIAMARALDETRGEARPLALLEIGGRDGGFAAQLHAALDHSCGAEGRELAARLAHVVTDIDEATLREASTSGPMAPLVALDRVRVARFDATRGEPPQPLGAYRLPPRYDLVACNYLLCVLPCRQLRRRGDAWDELYAEVGLPTLAGSQVADRDQAQLRRDLLQEGRKSGLLEELEVALEWREAELTPEERTWLDAATGEVDAAVIAVPTSGPSLVLGEGAPLADDGFCLVADFGHVARSELWRTNPRPPTVYAGTINHGVCFPWIDALPVLAREAAVWRSRDPLASVHHAVVRRSGGIDGELANALDEALEGAGPTREVQDLVSSARTLMSLDQVRFALRQYRRAIALVPDDARLRYEAAVCANDGELAGPAIAFLKPLLDAPLPDPVAADLFFELGRARALQREREAALRAYRLSLDRADRASARRCIALLEGSGPP